MNLILIPFALFIAWFLWTKVIKVYYMYYYYTSKGYPTMGIPLPVIGNGKQLFDNIKKMNDYSNDIMSIYLDDKYGNDLPPLIFD